MSTSVPALQAALKQIDSTGIHENIGEFDKLLENMEVKTSEIDAAMEHVIVGGGAISQDEVGSLLKEMQGITVLEEDKKGVVIPSKAIIVHDDPDKQWEHEPNAQINGVQKNIGERA